MRTFAIAAAATVMALGVRGEAAAQVYGGGYVGAGPVYGGGYVQGGPSYGGRWGQSIDGRWHGGMRAPGGWRAYRRPYRGWTVPRYWNTRDFYVGDYQSYGLSQPPYGYTWSRYYDDAVLIDGRGRVYDSVNGVDWNRWDASYSAGYNQAPGYPAYPYPGGGYGRRDDGLGGALIGGAIGAGVGAIAGGVPGALIGGGVGALAGQAIDQSEDRYGYGYGDGYGYSNGGSYAYAQGGGGGHGGVVYAPRREVVQPYHREGCGGYVQTGCGAGGWYVPPPTVTTITIPQAAPVTTTTTTTEYVTEYVDQVHTSVSYVPTRRYRAPVRRTYKAPVRRARQCGCCCR